MPIYEYHCTGCSEDFEVSQKITDDPLRDCPKCHGNLEKKISHSSFVLKGAGWYKTDYAGNAAPASAKDGAPACAASGSKPACSGCPSAGD
jgi:putative FmdB family regulatory protein